MPACNKKPAGNKVIKKPAAKAVHKTNVKVTPKAKAKDKNSVPKLTREQKAYWAERPLSERITVRPKGCCKCRHKPGCCPSCFLY